jgi:hypothetical protein
MFLSEITSAAVDVSNCDNDLTNRLTKIKTEIPFTPGLSMVLGKIINEAIRESGWLDVIRDEAGRNVPNPRNVPLITEFLKRFGSKYVWQTRFQTFMKTGTQMNNSGTHSCLTWDVFMSHLLIYGGKSTCDCQRVS